MMQHRFESDPALVCCSRRRRRHHRAKSVGLLRNWCQLLEHRVTALAATTRASATAGGAKDQEKQPRGHGPPYLVACNQSVCLVRRLSCCCFAAAALASRPADRWGGAVRNLRRRSHVGRFYDSRNKTTTCSMGQQW